MNSRTFTLANESATATIELGKETLVSECFDVGFQFEDEDQLAQRLDASEAKKRKGKRLGRLTYSFQTADRLNDNRRIYPSEVVKPAMDALAARVAKARVFGRLDHPGPFEEDSLRVTFRDAAVMVVEASMPNDTDVKVVLDILDNEHGRQLRSVMDVGGNPGTSQRAVAIWRDPTDEERERFKIPENEFAVVADALRLITYDVVSEPGFDDADRAAVTEHKTAKGDSIMELADLQAKHPSLYQQVLLAGRTEAEAGFEARLTEAREAGKAEGVASANETVTTDLEGEKTKNAELIAVFESLKPKLVELGVVNEKITDAEAAGRIATLEAKVEKLETDLTAANEAKTAAENAANEAKSRVTAFETLRKVSAQYAKHPHHNHILMQVDAKMKATPGMTEQQAMEAAAAVDAFIKQIAPQGAAATPPATPPGTPPVAPANDSVTPPTPTGSFFGSVEALLHPANPQAGSGGGDPANEGNEQTKAAGNVFGAQLPAIM